MAALLLLTLLAGVAVGHARWSPTAATAATTAPDVRDNAEAYAALYHETLPTDAPAPRGGGTHAPQPVP